MKPNLTTTLVQYLREQISSGRIAPGEKLPSENTLIAEQGVSRTVVREALTRLQAEGLVHTRRGAGSFALTPPARDESGRPPMPRTLAERRQLIEFRMGFESQAAALAASHHPAAALAELDSALAAFRAAGPHASRAMSCDYDFHLAVARASGNRYLVQAVEQFGPAMIAMPRERFELSDDAADPRLGQVAAEHETIRNAIAATDPLAAAAAMRVHLANSLHRLEHETGERSS
ncbi:GntR family transcriptional regulator [Glutamicibacter sp. MNS18]|uniref:FadR/GntR family transcriptional regulator n=1 Tax=Glutamicibacter sp. MNS18 TaxID=2989817 RepID=UPI002235E1D1|nr:GntR family transcriptional regulator [Glutamicibacter sp. MNS18]MCW4465668.1 GntR family transcriptional regulator [Glutamicibacter sp. MNS18]